VFWLSSVCCLIFWFHRVYCPSRYPYWNSNIVAEIAFCLEKFEEYRFLTNRTCPEVTISVYRDLSLQVPVKSRTCVSRSDTWLAKKATRKEHLTNELETTEHSFWIVYMAVTKRTCCISLCATFYCRPGCEFSSVCSSRSPGTRLC